MAGRYDVRVDKVDFGREVEIVVTDTRNPTKHFKLRIAEIHLDDIEEMLQAVLDKIAESRENKDDRKIIERLSEFFVEGALESRGEARPGQG